MTPTPTPTPTPTDNSTEDQGQMKTESQEHIPPVNSANESVKRINPTGLIKRFHMMMAGVTLVGLVAIFFQMGQEYLVPFGLGSMLVWANMTMLAKGLSGVLNGEKSIALLLLFKFVFLLGGVYVLAQVFPEQTSAVILGCSTWVIALLLLGQNTQTMQVALFVFCISAVYETAQAKPTEAEMLEGEVYVRVVDIPKSPMPKIIAEGIIKTAPKSLWAVISDCENFKKTMPNIKHSKHLGFVKGLKRCELIVDLPFPLSNLRSVVDVKLQESDKVFTRVWHLVEGDYHKNDGEWKLTARPDGYTHLRYTVHVEPKISVPDFIQRAAQKSKIPGVFENFTDLMKRRGLLLP